MKIITKILILYTLIFSWVYSYININPLELDKRIDGDGALAEYHLYNRTEKTIRYQISVEDGEINSMANWAEIYPTSVILKPGEEKTIKMLVKAPKGTEKGEYSLFLQVREQLIPNTEIKKDKNTEIAILTNLRVELDGYVGDIDPKLLIKEFQYKKVGNNLEFNGEIENIGERKGNYKLYITDKAKKNRYFLGDLTLLKNEKIKFSEFNQDIKNSHYLNKMNQMTTLIILEKEDEQIVAELKL